VTESLFAPVFRENVEFTVRDYRAYIVGKDGHFETFEVIHADSDENAVEAAQKFVDGREVEIWHLARKVAVLTPDGAK
jgi:hypothetical protein